MDEEATHCFRCGAELGAPPAMAGLRWTWAAYEGSVLCEPCQELEEEAKIEAEEREQQRRMKSNTGR